MGLLTIRRKGYKRKAYTRKNGVKVKATEVLATTFKAKDKGKSGRTPKSEQFYHPKVHTGWRKTMGIVERRALALRAHKGDKLATARALQALANVTTDQETARLARADALYFFKRHKGKGI